MIVSRTCTEIREKNDEQRQGGDSRPLEEFRSLPTYVLLGDPGAGKSTAFEMECEALGKGACKVTARDFLTFDLQNRPEWRGKTLFIDGLDEVRAGSSDARTPFDKIRFRLDALGKPRFRLSCREADWLGTNDREHLKSVSPDSAVAVLRLDPLTDSDVVSILDNRLDVANARNFISLAHEKGVAGFLTNPQTLDLLAKVVGDGGEWPTSRKELFEKACARMVREHNKEHQAAKASNNLPEPAQILDAAGRLCAVQLISGAAGWALHGDGDEAYPALDRCDYDRREMLRPALATKLFKGVSNNRLAPVHRHLAEFLAARHLAGVIEKKGLLADRVKALITGKDGIVVTEMRGLSAWLAAYCADARAHLIEQDPIGVGLYGDIREFSADEKRALLYSLSREASRSDSHVWRWAPALRALATPDMEPEFSRILTGSDRKKEHQRVIEFALRILREGDPLPGLSGILLEIVRDGTCWLDINVFALDAFIQNSPDDKDRTRQLKALLADIQDGSVSDPNNELLGILLNRLYPRDLSPPEVWDCFFDAGKRGFHGFSRTGRSRFCGDDILDMSSDDQIAHLLDELTEQFPRLRSVIQDSCFYELCIDLAARGIKVHGDRMGLSHLYGWFSIGSEIWQMGFEGQESIRDIRLWLEQRPEMQKALFMESLERYPESDEFRSHAFEINAILYDASPPSDYGLWCLEQAVAIVDSKPRVAEYLLGTAVRAFESQRGSEGLSREVLQQQTEKHEILRPIIARLLQPPPPPPDTFKLRARIREEQEQFMLDRFRSNEAVLRENRVAPDLLYEIARKYFSGFANSSGLEFAEGRLAIVEQASSTSGVQAVEQWLYGNQGLADAALQGLRGVIDRKDMPDVEEVLDLEIKRRMHYLGLPFLAALEEIKRTAPKDDASQWDDDRIRKAVAFYYCYGNHLHMPSGHGYCPQWYRRLLVKRPEIVAEVLVQYGRCVFQVGDDYVDPIADKFRRLELDSDHAQVAMHASLSLLRTFPIPRSPEDQSHLSSLDHLFWAAIRHADRALLQELIERKRSLKSISAAQRVRWLAAGAMVWPGKYTDLLRDFVQGDQESRVRYLKAFFGSRVYQGASKGSGHTSSFAGRELFRFDASKIPLWELLIRIIGSVVGPDWWGDHASDLVRMLIEDLVVCPEDSARNALTNLLADPALERWRDTLKQAQDTQRTIRRDAGYRHPDIEQVCETFNNLSPANPADLAAHLVDRLDEIARKIRGSSTSDWRQYWNVDSYNRSQDQKPEDACRDNLLSDLQEKLKPLGIDAQPEGQYANDKRADIRVSYTHPSAGYFQVPLEIKKNSHPKLWSAIHDQLIAKYASDPETDGYGIYLVFWFGEEYTETPSSSDGYPANAEEMKERLEALLSPDEARKISVCVIDVSIPEGKSAGK